MTPLVALLLLVAPDAHPQEMGVGDHVRNQKLGPSCTGVITKLVYPGQPEHIFLLKASPNWLSTYPEVARFPIAYLKLDKPTPQQYSTRPVPVLVEAAVTILDLKKLDLKKLDVSWYVRR